MVEIFFIFLLFCVAVFGKMKFKNLYNPFVMFDLLWLIILLLYSFHLNGLYKIESHSMLLIGIGIFSYDIGCLIENDRKRIVSYKAFQINFSRLNHLYIFAVSILGIGTIYNLWLLTHMGMSEIRYGGKMNFSYVFSVFRDFAAIPIVYLVMSIGFAEFIIYKKIKYLKKAFILLLFEFLATFEQACVYAFLILVITLILFLSASFSSFYKINKKVMKITVFLVILLSLLFFARGSSVFQRIYRYLSGCIVFFDRSLYHFQILGRENDIGRYTFGIASLQGLFRPFMGILEKAGFEWKSFSSADRFYWPYLGTPISIDETGKMYNSFATLFMYFYKDLGVAGIIVFSLLYGMFNCNIYKKYIFRKDIYSLALYLYIVIGISISFMQFPLVSQKYALAAMAFMYVRQNGGNKRSDISRYCKL